MVQLLMSAALAGVLAVGHDGEVVGDAIEWTTVVVADPPVDALEFAVPLPTDVELFSTGEVVLRDERIVGVAFDAPVRNAVLHVREPLRTGNVALSPPFVDADAVQRVTLAGADFVPDASLGIAHRVSDRKQLGISPKQERAADRVLDGRRKRLDERPMYLVADRRVREAGGLAGTLWPEHARDGAFKRGLGGVLVGTFGLFAAGLAWAMRRLAGKGPRPGKLEVGLAVGALALAVVTMVLPSSGAARATVAPRSSFVAPPVAAVEAPPVEAPTIPAAEPVIAVAAVAPTVHARSRPAPVDLLGAWVGTVDGDPATLVVQRSFEGRVSGVFYVDDVDGRREESVTGSLVGSSVGVSGPGIVLRLRADGWHLEGTCRTPDVSDPQPCAFDRRDR